MTLYLPSTFISPSHPEHRIQYVQLNASGRHTILYCYGAGGRARDLTLYQDYLSNHAPSISLLCVDRWTQGDKDKVSRSGPELSELSSITLELLDSLKIKKFSVAAHSAGAYHMLDLASRCKNRVEMSFRYARTSQHHSQHPRQCLPCARCLIFSSTVLQSWIPH